MDYVELSIKFTSPNITKDILIFELGELGFDSFQELDGELKAFIACLLYTSPSPRDGLLSRMPSSA